MSEKIHPNSYLLPAEFMEPQRPVTPEGYMVTSRKNIQSEELRSIPDELHPVYMRSATSEKVVKGGEGSEFNELQKAAYAEREKNRNAWIERSLGEAAVEITVEMPTDNSMDRLLDPDFDAEALSIEDAAVRPERTEEEILEEQRKNSDAMDWNANNAKYQHSKRNRE